MSETHQLVFLDRGSLDAPLRAPVFAHHWEEHPYTAHEQVVERLANATIAVTNKVPIRADDIARLPKLKMIAIAATGTNIIDLPACKERGIVVSNIRDYANATLPEHTFALILALRRNLLAYRESLEAEKWQAAKNFCILDHPIRDLAGSRLGIVGYGSLGKAVARLGQAFGMDVCVHTRRPESAAGATYVSMDELLRTSDVVTLHLPLTPDSRHLIGREELATMKRTALLINTARGGLVDEQALEEALKQGIIAGAGFDVLTMEPPRPDAPLLNLNLPNFMLTPHVAWASQQAMKTLADQLVDNIEAFVRGAPRNIV